MSGLVYLQPGQVMASGEPLTISTVLGSCVAVCLWDPHARVGGMNHYLLPDAFLGELSPRFAEPAIDQLVTRVRDLGSRNGHLTARLFGGACVIEALRHHGDHLGWRNVAAARARLLAARVPVVSEDVGGQRGRKVVFRLVDGSTTVTVL